MRSILLLAFLAGCHQCPYGAFADVTSYSIEPSKTTPKGIRVDDSGFELDLAEVNRRTDEVEACLRNKYPDGQLPAEVVGPGACLRRAFPTTVDRQCLAVKVAPNWHVDCRGEQTFPCSVDPRLCLNKGLDLSRCPCECRSAIQGQNSIVVTPDLKLYEGDVIRIQTGCDFIWIPGLEECFR